MVRQENQVRPEGDRHIQPKSRRPDKLYCTSLTAVHPSERLSDGGNLEIFIRRVVGNGCFLGYKLLSRYFVG